MSAQKFEADRGGFYFFSPTKDGFIGYSTSALNLGIGEYVSTTTHITTYNSSGEKAETSSVDCADGLTAGFTNEENERAYLLSYFYNAKNSLYKLRLHRIDKEANVDRININLKSSFSEVIGYGKYTIDLKYALATDNSFVFVFSKTKGEIETYYLVQVRNKNDEIKITEIESVNIVSNNNSTIRYLYDGMRTLYVLTLKSEEKKYDLSVQSYGLADLEFKTKKEIQLDFLSEDLILSHSKYTRSKRSYEGYFSASTDADGVQADSLLQYHISKGEIVMTGLYKASSEKNSTALNTEGAFMAIIHDSTEVIKKESQKISFNELRQRSIPTNYYYSFVGGNFYWAYSKLNNREVIVTKNVAPPVSVMLGKRNAEQGIILALDQKRVIPGNNLKEGKSKLLQTLKSFYCLYDLKQNSVGFYTKCNLIKL